MNEHLTTLMGAEHRQALLEEARANGLARIARDGRPTFWQHLSGLMAGVAGGRWPARRHHVHTPVQHAAH